MKILVFSDSHGSPSKIVKAIEAHKGKADLVIFLGDGLRDIEYVKGKFPSLTFFCVRGNCDFLGADVPKQSVLDLDGIRILVCHGDRYNVKYTLDTIKYAGAELEVDAILFGHTHSPCEICEYVAERRIQLFNPGSIGTGDTYGVLNTSGKTLVTGVAKIN